MRAYGWLAVLMVLSLGMLLLGGFWVKGPCVDAVWDGHQYERRCYTDLIPLYGGRGLDESQMPYLEEFNEYPVLTGMWMYATSLVSDDSSSFFIWNAIGLGLMGLGTTFVLWRTTPTKASVLWWAIAPALMLYSFHNWDLIAVLFMVLGLHAYSRERPLLAGMFLGLGTAAKIFPGLLVPVLLADLTRRAWQRSPHSWRQLATNAATWRLAGGALGTWSLVNLPFILIRPGMWWQTYAFHSDRGPTIESHWNVLRHYAARWDQNWLLDLIGPEALPTVSLVLLAVGILGMSALVLTGRLGWLPGCLGTLLSFLIANQVISIQYMLWIAPLLALVPLVPWKHKVFLLAADVLVYLAVFDYFHLRDLGEAQVGFEQLAVASILRLIALALVLGAVILGGWRAGISSPLATPGPSISGAPRLEQGSATASEP